MTTDDTIPGMAEAIEAEQQRLTMSPGEFAEAAGLSRTILADVRAGRAKNYQMRTLRGVAAALAWPIDWYDRLRAGELPSEWEQPSAVNSGAGMLTAAQVVDLLERMGVPTGEAEGRVAELLRQSGSGTS